MEEPFIASPCIDSQCYYTKKVAVIELAVLHTQNVQTEKSAWTYSASEIDLLDEYVLKTDALKHLTAALFSSTFSPPLT